MLESGQYLQQGRYRIKEHLNQGGMGTVYLATDRNLSDRLVALKENSDSSAEAQEQFQSEAVILARLTHPNLPRVTDHFVEPSGRQYLVMDYIGGEDLRQILNKQGGPLPEADVLLWMAQVMDALEYMHSWVDSETGQPSPIVHRDIKPSNIKHAPNNRIVLVDFGVAKYQTGIGTQIGARAITPGYSPVEQYTGGTDIRSDLYALGATFYTLLTAVKPPDAPTIAGGRTLEAPRKLNPQLSRNTERVILRAMQIQPAARFQSIAEMREALTNKPLLNFATDRRMVGGSSRAKAQHADHQPRKTWRWLWLGLVVLIALLAFVITVDQMLPKLVESFGGASLTTMTMTPTPVKIAQVISPTSIITKATTISAVQPLTASPTASQTQPLVVTPVLTPLSLVVTGTATPTPTTALGLSPTSSNPSAAAHTPSATAALTAPSAPPPTLLVTLTPTLSPTATPSPTPANTVTPRPTDSPTATVTPWPTNTATTTKTATPLPSATTTATPSPTTLPSATATPSPLPTLTFTPSSTASNTPTNSPTALPTATPSPSATATATNTATPITPVAGATQVNPMDSAVYVFVPAGPFVMGSTTTKDEQPVHTVTLQAFWIKQTEVTNAEYGRCVTAKACTPPTNQRWSDPAFASHPVTNINWAQANQYAEWVGGRLPTEAEWEKVARGADARVYPWGQQEISDQLLNYNFVKGATVPVGSYPDGASTYGALDMAGNVEEWVADWYSDSYYASSPAENPAGPEQGIFRVVRGGSFNSTRVAVRTTARGKALPNTGFPSVGFRVVR